MMDIFTIKNKNNTLININISDKIVMNNSMVVLLKYKTLYNNSMNLYQIYMNHNIKNKNLKRNTKAE